ncbi:MAG: hypothetical protein ABIZ81_01895 [Opitutaceae bacterium]
MQSRFFSRAVRFSARLSVVLSCVVLGSVLHAAESAPLKRYLYLGFPDGSQAPVAPHAPGIAVYDIDDGHKLVRFIPVPEFIQGGGNGVNARPLGLRGLCVSLANHAAYYTAENGLVGCLDLETEKVVWEKHLPEGADRADVTLDGKKLYVPTGYWDRGVGGGMLVVDALNGNVLKRLGGLGPGSHNSFVTLDGKHVLVAGIEWIAMFRTSDDAKVMYLDGIGDGGMFPFTIDSKLEKAYISRYRHVGVDIVSLKTGAKVHTFQDGMPPIPRRTHGAALTPDEKELWLSDQSGQRLLVMDNTVFPPVLKQEIKLIRDGHGWVLFSMDGRFAWTHTEEVFDAHTKKLVATLKDENGQPMTGSKYFEVHFRGKKVVAVGNQFALGRAALPASAE